MEDKNGGFDLLPVEATIPPGKANKPFWAHGVDLLGYSLGSRRHALLPFHDSDSPRSTGLIRSSLSFNHTQALLQVSSIDVRVERFSCGLRALIMQVSHPTLLLHSEVVMILEFILIILSRPDS